jgi:hypothetical protein
MEENELANLKPLKLPVYYLQILKPALLYVIYRIFFFETTSNYMRNYVVRWADKVKVHKN